MSNDIDAEVPQVLRCQRRQNRVVYLVLAEYRLVPFEAQAPQPNDDIHDDARYCQSAANRDPLSASKRDPFDRRGRAVALAPSELVGVAKTARARVV